MQTVSAPELEGLYREIVAELAYFGGHLPFKDCDDTTVVLKGHLLIEEQLVAFVASYLTRPEKIERFTFDQYLRLGEALNSAPAFDWVFEACRQLNGLRNRFSHQLSPERVEERMGEIIKFVSSQGVYVFKAEAVSCNRAEFRMAILTVYSVLRHMNRKLFRPVLPMIVPKRA